MGMFASLTRSWLTRSLKPFEFTANFDDALPFRETENLGLYVHVPFCRSLCAFCPYCKVGYDEALAARYVEALLREIELVAGLPGPRKKATSLYFGGGTPALVAEHIGRIVSALEARFDIAEGVGLELHPRDVTAARLRQLRDAGVSKISIGVQSFQDRYLGLLGRGAFDEEAMFAALREVPFETVSMDFIFALPGQTIETMGEDVERAFANGANHVALYPFIDFTYTDGAFPRMDRAEKKRLLYDLVDYCEGRGYVRDSVWTFSKDGRSRYSSMTRDNFLGFGCSATTLLEDQFKINTFDPVAYIERIGRDSLPTALTLRFTERQRMVYYLFWSAYTLQVDPAAFRSFFGRSLEDAYGAELALACRLGLAERKGGRYVMTAKGSYYYHYFESFYTLSYIDQVWSLMRSTPFPDKLVIR